MRLDQVISQTLKTPFTVEDLRRHDFSCEELIDLGTALRDHYDSYKLPLKSEGHLRPYISPIFSEGYKLGLDYVFGKGNFDSDWQYKYIKSSSEPITYSIKKYLLYCHGICVQDPLPYLLDYFVLDGDTPHSRARIPAVKDLLIEYAELKDLIAEEIVFPISDEMMSRHGTTHPLSNEERIAFGQRTSHIPGANILAQAIRSHQISIEDLENRADMFLPNADAVTVLRELLRASHVKFSSREIIEPFGMSVLGEVSSINPSRISTADIIKMRGTDDVFADLRAILFNTFEQLYRNREDYTDIDQEYSNIINERLLEWDLRLKARKGKSRSLSNALETGGKVLLGSTAAVIASRMGADTGTALTIGSISSEMVQGAIRPLLEGLKSQFKIEFDRSKQRLIRRHFMAITGKG